MTLRELSKEELDAKLRKVNEYSTGFNLVSDQVVIADSDAHILYINKAAEEITGYKLDEVIGKNPGDLWGGLMSKEFYEEMWNTIKVLKKPWIGNVQNKGGGRQYVLG